MKYSHQPSRTYGGQNDRLHNNGESLIAELRLLLQVNLNRLWQTNASDLP